MDRAVVEGLDAEDDCPHGYHLYKSDMNHFRSYRYRGPGRSRDQMKQRPASRRTSRRLVRILLSPEGVCVCVYASWKARVEKAGMHQWLALVVMHLEYHIGGFIPATCTIYTKRKTNSISFFLGRYFDPSYPSLFTEVAPVKGH